jgi:eukaryotic-like serine/threonine-protein kinase
MKKTQEAAEQLFGEALDLSPGERPAFLERACEGRPELRRLVEGLLDQNDHLQGFLSDPLVKLGDQLLDGSRGNIPEDVAGERLEAGVELGPYRIEQQLGQGGMGQVYRAWDTRLGRPVAIKTCRPELLERFKLEARSIAAISHPHVCTLYDVGPGYLVMELVEGETLAARLKRGKLTLAQTLRYGAQIAAALAAAHARGIVHRDLKPANLMLTKSGVKVLDFGLARSQSNPNLTEPGHVIGTPAYMAPELMNGEEADERSDLYALGLILTEMATGHYSRLPQDLPSALERVVRRCLESDPDDRWHSARDLEWELESIAQAQAETRSRPRRTIPAWMLVVAGLAIVGLGALTAWQLGRHGAVPPLVRVNIVLPDKALVRSLAVSPDGRFVAVVLVKDGKQQIWIRALDGLDLTPLEGTDDATDPFWSPDGQFLAFFADSKLKKIERTGGPVQTLCDSMGAEGGTWNGKGDILIGALDQVLRVSDAGGAVSRIPGHAGIREVFPVFLPDGRHYVANRVGAGLWLNSMDGPEARQILPDNARAQVVAASSGSRVGAILFTRAGALMALPFDEKRLEAAGEAFAVTQQIAGSGNWEWLAASSYNGVVAYVSGHFSTWQYVWRDRQGKNLGAIGDAGGVVMISPDGKQLVGDPAGQITTLEFGSRVSTRLTVTSWGQNPTWSPDGRYVAYDGSGGIYRKATAGGAPPELLLRSQSQALTFPKSWSPDGHYLIYAQVYPGRGSDLLALPIDQPGAKPIALWQTPATSDQGEFSPDGHWVAVTSTESGQSEIYVIPFPPTADEKKWVVSTGGGVMPRWRRDGRELYYVSPDWKMMAVDVDTQPTFRSGTPRALFDTEMVDTGIRNGPMSWDVAPDGKRFLIITEKTQEASYLNVILNWRAQK